MLKLACKVRILDLDRSVTSQSRLLAQLGGRARVSDFTDLGSSLRYLCSKSAIGRFEQRLRAQDRNMLTFIGSGDFHHITASLLRQFDEPLTLVVFDTHSDWDRRPPFPCCGSWVADALRMPQVKRIISIGLAKADIGGWRVMLGHPAALKSGRAVFFPFDCSESRTIGGAQLYSKVEGADWNSLTGEILRQIPPGNVYISIDKDCLVAEDAFTNWEVGGMQLMQLVSFLGRIRETHDIIGADITGEYSPIALVNPIFAAIARWDHPRKTEPTAEQRLNNEQTNLALLTALEPG